MKTLPSALMLTLLASGAPLARAEKAGARAVPPQETFFSKSLRFTGEVVDVLPSGKAIRRTAIHGGRTFTWRGKLGALAATPDPEPAVSAPPVDVDELTLDKLAEELRALMLFAGHEFLEAEPAYDLARNVKRYRQRERAGASPVELASLLPYATPSQGRATAALRGESPRPARGEAGPNVIQGTTDNRDVQDNTDYPHRVQIVFDNTSTSSGINGSEGSGTLIGPSTALSAAHVFWDEDNDTWEATHRWAPGFDSQDADSSPWGDWVGCYVVIIPSAYTNGNEGRHDYAVVDFDTGCNSVDNGVNSDEPGSTVGWLGFYTASQGEIQGETGFVRGYPGIGTCGTAETSCNVRVWGDTSSASENNATANEIHHQADTSGGMSGSGFYHYANPSCSGCGEGAYLVGIHRAGSDPFNVARKYDATLSSFVHANSSDY